MRPLAGGRNVVKEEALPGHGQEPGHSKSHRNTGKRNDIEAEQGPACPRDKDLPQDRACGEAHQRGTPAVARDPLVHTHVHHTVDVRVVGDLCGRGKAVEKFQELAGQQPLGVEQHEPRGDEAEALQQHHGLVAEVVGGEEHRQEQRQVRVCPHWVDLIEDLAERGRSRW